MRFRLREVLALTTVSYLLSVFHSVFGGFYTDILMSNEFLVGPTHNSIPYLAYYMPYPAIPAITIWISGFGTNAVYFLWIMAFLTFPFVIGAAYFLYRICTEFRMDRGRIIPFFIMAPSFLVLSFYSWDILPVSFVCAAIYYALKKSSRLSGLCLGLGFAAKAYPLLLLPVFLKEMQTWQDRFDMFLATVLGGLIPNLPFIILAFPGWFRMETASYGGQGGMYLENSLWFMIRSYNLLNQDRLMVVVTWSLIILTILLVTFSSKPLVLKLWLIIAATILVFPTYPPQFNVWLLPLFVLNPIFPLIPFLAFDFLDTAVILSWFTANNPWEQWGPIWILSLMRIGLLVVLLVWAVRKGSTIVRHI